MCLSLPTFYYRRDTLLISSWCREVEAKQANFSPLPDDAPVLAALQLLMLKGTV